MAVEITDPEPASRAVTFPLFGLPWSWTGPRWVGGWGGDPPHQFELAHGGPWDSPVLRVGSHLTWPSEEIAAAFATSLGFLDHDLSHHQQVPRAKDLDWEAVDILVEGEPQSFQLLKKDGDWQAWWQHPNVVVVLDGRGRGGFPIEDVELILVRDTLTTEDDEAVVDGLGRECEDR